MTKNKIILVTVLGLTSISLSVSAQGTTATEPAPIRKNTGPNIRVEARQQVKTEVKDFRKETQTNIKAIRKDAINNAVDARKAETKTIQGERKNTLEDIKKIRQTASTTGQIGRPLELNVRQAIEQKREELGKIIEAKRADFKEQMDARKTEIKDRIAAQKEELKKKLNAIKDTKKKELVQNLDTKFTEVNNRQLDGMTQTLNQLENVLKNIGIRADKAESNGKDVSLVRNAAVEAETAITTARNAILTQSAKTYPINITTETALKNNVDDVRKSLQADLEAVRALVKTAHELTRKSATLLMQIPNVNAPAPATPILPENVQTQPDVPPTN
jgi:Skp family chaperone for outer membrane proteins